jgi:hypothetical protein
MINYNSLLYKNETIVGVPSVYVNGYSLPNSYTIEDIKYHMSSLEKMEHPLPQQDICN